MRIAKQQIYTKYGIKYDSRTGKIESPLGWINPVLVKGNRKIGPKTYHFSTLPGTKVYNLPGLGKVKGTCSCDCKDCYGKKGCYRYTSVQISLGIKTVLARKYQPFLENAIRAQIEADGIRLLRIHATGDFIDDNYTKMFKRIVRDYPDVTFWTYTKTNHEHAFDEFLNANIVKSCLPKAYHYGEKKDKGF